MDKRADQFLTVSPWQLIEQGFHPEHAQVAESLFALANEHMGVRGYFEEGYSGKRLLGSYFNGLYDYSQEPPQTAYKGVVTKQHFMVNAADWLATKITAEGEQLDLGKIDFSDFKRVLDMRTGVLTREFTWHLHSGKLLRLKFTRFLDMEEVTSAYQQITLAADSDLTLNVTLGINFDTKYGNGEYKYWQTLQASEDGNRLLGQTLTTKQQLACGQAISVQGAEYQESAQHLEKQCGRKYVLQLKNSQPVTINKHVINLVNKHPEHPVDLMTELQLKLDATKTDDFGQAVLHQAHWWQCKWQQIDIQIDGDPKNQQGIRFCLFQLVQTYRGLDPHDNIGAKGLTGEAYNGHAFWDTETGCLPFYLFTDPKAARSLLGFRYQTLPQARNRAKELDCLGACYPIATLNGDEASNLWQHASTQLQPSSGVAYAIWHYEQVTGDTQFLVDEGLEMLLEISRFLYSRGDYGQTSGSFGWFGVMGPDEFQVMVNHNQYTNIMNKHALEYTIATYRDLSKRDPETVANLAKRLNLLPSELDAWQRAAEHVLVLQDDRGIFEQHQGFFDLPHVDISKIPNRDFPLYDHWSYDRLFRNDMIKQPDVLMFLFLYDSSFSQAVKQANYDYYEPRTIHESSLSPSIHSVLAAELHEYDAAWRFFEFATRLDLDNYNRNTEQGLHTTSLASAWLNIVYGFGGLRSDGKQLALAPTLPKLWHGYRFTLTYRQSILHISVDAHGVHLRCDGPEVALQLYGKACVVAHTIRNYPIAEAFKQVGR